MTWKERFGRLPLLLNGTSASLEFIEGHSEESSGTVGGAKYVIFHNYIPDEGNRYIVTLRGNMRGRRKILNQIVAELGEPLPKYSGYSPEIWFFCWFSDEDSTPRPEMEAILGSKMQKILEPYTISPQEEQIILDILLLTEMDLLPEELRFLKIKSILETLDPDLEELIREVLAAINESRKALEQVLQADREVIDALIGES